MLEVLVINCLADNYSYLIRDKKTNAVGVIDPSEFKAVNSKIEKTYRKLDFILNTHHHNDHVGGNLELKKKYNSKIICSKLDEKRIPGADIKKNEGEEFLIGETKFQVISVPGHTLGHIAFYSENSKIIFTGDTIFSLGCGRIFEGTHLQMLNSIEKIMKLPKSTLVYCGHEYTKKNGEFCLSIDETNIKLKERIKNVDNKLQKNLPSITITLGEELETNIFFRFEDNKVKNKLKMNNASKLEVFTKLRNLKDQF